MQRIHQAIDNFTAMRERQRETFVTFSQAITVLAIGTRSRQSRTVYSVSAKVCNTFLNVLANGYGALVANAARR